MYPKPYYDVAQVCRRGHLTNSSTKDSPERNKQFCPECGEKTITACERCATAIHGQYHNVLAVYRAMHEPPAFCHGCGTPYPWTAEGIEAAKALADELAEGKDDDRIMLKASIDDLVIESPKTQLALVRFRKIVDRFKGPVREALLDLMAKIAVESAKAGLGH